MAEIFVGPVAAGLADGTSWANRYGSITDAEDRPIVAGDLCWIGPGVYREKLTVDVSGGAGTEITFCGDVTGQNTDGVGGVVRVTGSDNDETAVRDHCVEATDKDYRTFREIRFDFTTADIWDIDGNSDNWVVEDCCFLDGGTDLINITGTANNWLIPRCFFAGQASTRYCIVVNNGIPHVGNHAINNCFFLGQANGYAFSSNFISDVDIRNCTFLFALRVASVGNIAPDNTIVVENCIIAYCDDGLFAGAANKLIEDYNTFWNNTTDRTNVAVGANSETFPPLLETPLLFSGAGQISGYEYPWWFGMLSDWSAVRAITGNAPEGLDMLGIPRPPNNAQRSWGALQYHDMERETGTVYQGTASLVFHDAGRWQMWVPVTAVTTTISVYVYREANYAGNLPQMIIKQPGQADRVTTDIGLASAWGQLTDTFTPAASPPYVVVELVSRNVSVAGAYEVFFDNLLVE